MALISGFIIISVVMNERLIINTRKMRTFSTMRYLFIPRINMATNEIKTTQTFWETGVIRSRPSEPPIIFPAS